ncbi:MAG: stage 0 sporulation family protein [Phycisphaerales bacterium JB038]
MPIIPLPQFEEDLAQHQREQAEAKAAARPQTVVVRYGKMGHIAELSYRGEDRMGCGSKLIIRSRRGTEIADVLTTTCANGGCGNNLTRESIREYINSSGGHDYPFSENGRILRPATADDLLRQQEMDAQVLEVVRDARERAKRFQLRMTVVDAEPILGGELLTIFFVAEDRVDFRNLVSDLAGQHRTRIEMRQVGARDEARLLADYEKCGQHCCCKQFLKVLKPVSMKAAKTQKATLDPTKISGRCGRLMCCLRYEDKSYAELKKLLPHKKTRVGTPEGPGLVLDTQILTQLVLVRLESNGQSLAVPNEDLCDPESCPVPEPPKPAATEYRRRDQDDSADEDAGKSRKRRRGGRRRKRGGGEEGQPREAAAPATTVGGEGDAGPGDQPRKKRKRRRRKRKSGSGEPGGGGGAGPESTGPRAESGGGESAGGGAPSGEGGQPRKKRRRRRRKKRGGGGDSGNSSGGGGGDGQGGD